MALISVSCVTPVFLRTKEQKNSFLINTKSSLKSTLLKLIKLFIKKHKNSCSPLLYPSPIYGRICSVGSVERFINLEVILSLVYCHKVKFMTINIILMFIFFNFINFFFLIKLIFLSIIFLKKDSKMTFIYL